MNCGVDRNEQTDEPDVPLPVHHAVENDTLEFSRLLLRAGADPNARYKWGEGETALRTVCRYEHVECVEEVLRWGADMEQPERRDGGGRLTSGVAGEVGIKKDESVNRYEDEEVVPSLGESG